MHTPFPFLDAPRNIGDHIHRSLLKVEIIIAALAGAPCPCCNGQHPPEELPPGSRDPVTVLTERVAQLHKENIFERLDKLAAEDDDAIRKAGFDDRVQVLTISARAHRIALWTPPGQPAANDPGPVN